MLRYLKAQWFHIVVGAINLGLAIWEFCIGDEVWGIAWVLSAAVWWLVSFASYNAERISLLEKKAEKYDALCDEVDALRKEVKVLCEINRQNEEHVKRLEQKITQLKFTI